MNSEEREKTNNIIEILKGITSIKVNGKVVYLKRKKLIDSTSIYKQGAIHRITII